MTEKQAGARPREQGRILRLNHRSEVLADNPWNDPVDRDLMVYLPAAYDEAGAGLPVMWQLAAYTNSGLSMGNWRNFGENLVQRLDRLIGSGQMGPAVVIAPDCFTRLGGNQYVNSASVGAYEDYIHEELIPFAESRLNLLPGQRHRAVFGKSSGGYGAMLFGMRRPDCWAALASHSGDVQFDVIFRRDFPALASALARYDYSVEEFLEQFWQSDPVRGSDVHALMLLCMAASYDPDNSAPARIRLPFDPETLELDETRWRRWLEWDPITLLPEHAWALKSLEFVYMDCGNRDQYFMQYGCRRLHRMMNDLGIEHVYEEFDGTHSGIDHRLDESLPRLYQAISLKESA